MKFALRAFVILWFLCGLVGAWVLDDLDAANWRVIARGPITLVKALTENPISIPGISE